MRKKNIFMGMSLAILFIGFFQFTNNMDMEISTFLYLKEDLISKHLEHGTYRCCLNKPCSYCIGDAHDGRKGCYCLENIMNGKSPCGECVGEILEGNGNKILAPYFAEAISENTGHEETVKQIISEKYNIPIEKQV